MRIPHQIRVTRRGPVAARAAQWRHVRGELGEPWVPYGDLWETELETDWRTGNITPHDFGTSIIDS